MSSTHHDDANEIALRDEQPEDDERFDVISFNLQATRQANQAYDSYSRATTKRSPEEPDAGGLSLTEADPLDPDAPPPTNLSRSASHVSDEDDDEDDDWEEDEDDEPDWRSRDFDDVLTQYEQFQQAVGAFFQQANQNISRVGALWLGRILGFLAAIWAIIMIPLRPVLQRLGLVLAALLRQIRRFLSWFSDVLHRRRKAMEPEKSESDTLDLDLPAAPPAFLSVSFSDMMAINVAFMSNQKVPLYSTRNMGKGLKLGPMEEQLISSNALEAIRECATFTTELPPPSEGPYAGRPIYEIMERVTEEDLKRFLYFVKSYPGKYIGKSWKISETFATWLINNAPEGDG